MARVPRCLLLAACVGGIALPRVARAEDVAAAAAQFESGVADMTAKRYEAGCPKIGESFRLDPRPGTLYSLARCEHEWGKVASAIAHYDAYLRMYETLAPTAREAQRTRPDLTRAALAELAPRVATLAIVLDGWPASARVEKNGAALGGPSLGRALPTDPGPQKIVVTAEGFVPFQIELVLVDGDRKEVRAPARAAEVAPPIAPDTGKGDGQRIAGFVIGGVGVAGLVVGVVGGALALSKTSDVDAHCGADRVCDSEEAKANAEAAQGEALLSTVGFIAGGALLAAGVVIVLTAPGDEAPVAFRVEGRTVAGGGVVEGGLRW